MAIWRYKEIPIDILKRDNQDIYQRVFDYAVLTGKIIKPRMCGSTILWRDEVLTTDPNIELVRIGMPRYGV